MQDFTARPDIADDCFLLASRCIRYCPDLFVLSSIFPYLIDCSMVGITIQHRYHVHPHLLVDFFVLLERPIFLLTSVLSLFQRCLQVLIELSI